MVFNCISFGGCNLYYYYVLGAIICKTLNDYLFGFSTINRDNYIGIFGFQPVLSDYYLIKSFFIYLSYIIFGSVFLFILKKQSIGEMEATIPRESLVLKGIIHNKKLPSNKKIFKKLLLVGLIRFFHREIMQVLYLLGFQSLDFGTIEILFILLFMNHFFINNIYKHKKCAIIFIVVFCSILSIIGSFFPYTKHEKIIKDDIEYLSDYNSYYISNRLFGNYWSVTLVIFSFLVVSFLISFCRVYEKVLMDFEYISLYKIIICTGIIGVILTLICLCVVTFCNCGQFYVPISPEALSLSNYCRITDFNIEEKTITYYYDNIIIYFKNLYEKLNPIIILDNFSSNKKEFWLEILLVIPSFSVVNFFQITCELLAINKLNPIYLLVRDHFYFGLTNLILLLKNRNNYQEYITTWRFVFEEGGEVFALIGYLIYFEIIELRFSGMDENLRESIIGRGVKDIDPNFLGDEGNSSDDEEEKTENSKSEEMDYELDIKNIDK